MLSTPGRRSRGKVGRWRRGEATRQGQWRGARIDFPPAAAPAISCATRNRAFQRLLERRIAPYGVTRGQWYFLRVLWEEDGLSQRELSARVGMMEPTTVIALHSMEKRRPDPPRAQPR